MWGDSSPCRPGAREIVARMVPGPASLFEFAQVRVRLNRVSRSALTYLFGGAAAGRGRLRQVRSRPRSIGEHIDRTATAGRTSPTSSGSSTAPEGRGSSSFTSFPPAPGTCRCDPGRDGDERGAGPTRVTPGDPLIAAGRRRAVRGVRGFSASRISRCLSSSPAEGGGP